MRRCKGVLLAGMLMLSMSVPVYADKSAVVKVEAPADTTDYYMTVDSGGVGVDIYPVSYTHLTLPTKLEV